MPSDASPKPAKRALLDLTFTALERELVVGGLRPAHAKTLWRALHRDLAADLADRAEFLPPLRRWAMEQVGSDRTFTLRFPEVIGEVLSSDQLTRKLLLRLSDGQTVETVVMGFTGRETACVSTQAGCVMGCVFCATGQMGFVRHLAPGEIVAQVRQAQIAAKTSGKSGLRNLVLMGMGEPLHNYDAVMTALEIVCHPRGLGLAPGHITISTVGVVLGILRLAAEQRPYHLAVSLHGATDEERTALVPIGRRWPLVELMAACRTYTRQTGRRIFFEWTLIAGTNDSPEHAGRLAVLLGGIESHVNLIPLNPTDGYVGSATRKGTAQAFQHVLRAAGIPSTLRQRRGIDVAAGCGQLRADRANADAKSPGAPLAFQD